MFTEDQIHAAMQRVRSGADYPKLVVELKQMGVRCYHHDVADGSNTYHGQGGKPLRISHPQDKISVSQTSSADKLKQALKTHQDGKTDYPTFCLHAAEAGVEKWVSDLQKMTVTYFDQKGQALVEEQIPAIPLSTISAHIAKHLRDAYFGGNWTWSNVRDQLSDVTWNEAITKVDDLNTILALTCHIHYYVATQLTVLRGEPLKASDKLSWQHTHIQSEDDWNSLLQQMWHETESLAQLIEKLPDSKLLQHFTDPKYGSYYRNLAGNIEHMHYHLGQIAIIKKLVRNRN